MSDRREGVVSRPGSHASSLAAVSRLPIQQVARMWAGANAAGDVVAGRLYIVQRPRRASTRPPRWLLYVVLGGILIGGVIYETRTSALQSWLLSRYAKSMTYTVEAGPSSTIVFPKSGPFDERHGYTQIPEFARRLEAKGFRIREQARFSPELARIAGWGIAPPYREPAVAGLTIRSADHLPVYDRTVSDRVFKRFEDVPPIVIEALLLIENRELGQEPPDSRTNPVLEWDRLAKAGITYAGTKLGLPLRVEGGSTLATQLEKYRHSQNGRTGSLADKLQQMAGASLKVYREGTDTRTPRREIILDYLNTVPLAAAPGHGEIHGLGDGLNAWFGLNLSDVSEALANPKTTPAKVEAYKHVLTLLCSVRAPSYYLVHNREALQARVNSYANLLARTGAIDPDFAEGVRATQVAFVSRPATSERGFMAQQKTSNVIRTNLMSTLGIAGFYDLDRLHLEVRSTLDAALQSQATQVFENLKRDEYLDAKGLRGKHLLPEGDPEKVVYTLMLYENTPEGNLLRVQTDSLADPFDLNEGMKLELGSTAKLRTLAHYLEVVASLHGEFQSLEPRSLAERAENASDPITRWVAETMGTEKGIKLNALLQKALDQTYSASPWEAFFTGGGLHSFSNFDPDQNERKMSLREATQYSTNLVFIRLMRDLVRFHQARLSYDAATVLADPEHPTRRALLNEAVDDEVKQILHRAYKRFHGLSPNAVVSSLLDRRAKSSRHLAILFFAWHRRADQDPVSGMDRWLKSHGVEASPEELDRLVRAYQNPRLTLADYAYLLDRHPLDVWCAEQMMREPATNWTTLWDRSASARQVVSRWLFQPRNRRAQDTRLRIRIEQDAFARMTPYWQRLGFPFERLVPSYATAIGNSSDRPAALSELMGVIVNDGVRQPSLKFSELRFAEGTPYHTVLEPSPPHSERIMAVPVARALKTVLANVVEGGTARRVSGAFVGADGKPVKVGGKTGSGDNRLESYGRYGRVLSSKAVSRTATFVFYIGDRYYGVLTAFVSGREAQNYEFTSALPVAVLKLLSPAINQRMQSKGNLAKDPREIAAHVTGKTQKS
jgi:membrane peptidoglycan carboxypeptidase